MSIHGPPKPVWRPPQDVAGFCLSHRPARPSYKGPPLPVFGPALPEHIERARDLEQRQRLIDAMSRKGYRLTFEER